VCNGLICGGGTGTTFGVLTCSYTGVETGVCKCGDGYALNALTQCCDKIPEGTTTCTTTAAPTRSPTMSPASGAICLNGGDYNFALSKCQCYGGWTGTNCQSPAIPVGWNIVPPTSCSGLPLQSTDMPLQSTWLRMQLSSVDNIYTFKPFASSGLEILKDITIGLDTPYIMAGNILMSGPPGAGETLTGQAVLGGWIGFGGNSFVPRASIITQMSLGSGTIGRRLLATSKSQLRADERDAADLFAMDHDYPTGAGSMVMAATAIRLDLPTGFSVGAVAIK